MVAVAALLFHANLRLPTAPQTWLLFVLALALAAVIAFLLAAVGLLATHLFWRFAVRSYSSASS